MSNEAMKLAFEHWWHHEGSAFRPVDEDVEEFAKRMCEIAWSNGAHKALAEQPAQRKPLTDEQQIAEALRVQGLTLVKTASGYEVLKLGQIAAHNIKEQP